MKGDAASMSDSLASRNGDVVTTGPSDRRHTPANAHPPATATPAERVPRRFWVGLVAAIVYVALAGGVAELLTEWISTEDDVAELSLGHFPVLIPLVAAGVWFVWWAGWTKHVWRTPAAFETHPRRWWMLAFPALLLVQSIVLLAGTPWGAWSAAVLVKTARPGAVLRMWRTLWGERELLRGERAVISAGSVRYLKQVGARLLY